MNKLFIRSSENPILAPRPEHEWENFKLYNPGAIYHKKQYHLFYRAMNEGADWASVIGYAHSEDGVEFKRQRNPLLTPEGDIEKRGLEDPRITKIDNRFIMAYAAYDGKTPRLSIATSSDLTTWKKHGAAFADFNFQKYGGVFTSWENGKPVVKEKNREWSKAGGIFPKKLKGKHCMLFGEHRIWIAESNDGLKWQAYKKPFLSPRTGDYFDNVFVEMGPPPILTKKGWLVIYHGINREIKYQLGFLILKHNDPYTIIYRSKKPIFSPETEYELKGLVDALPGGVKNLQSLSTNQRQEYLSRATEEKFMPQVVFCCGAVLRDDQLRIYYGCGDSVIGTAVADINDILNWD